MIKHSRYCHKLQESSVLVFHEDRSHYEEKKDTFFMLPKTENLTFICPMQLMLGIVASATGAAGSVAYIGLKGNKHTGWGKICGTYDKFCRYIGASLAVSLVSAILLLLLTVLSILSLYRRIHY